MQAQFFLMDNRINTAVSTSAGRLFDGLSAALGLCRTSTFEGQGAMALQFAAEDWEREHGGRGRFGGSLVPYEDRYVMPAGDVVMDCIRQYLRGGSVGEAAYAFHCALAEMAAAAAGRACKETGIRAVALSGGVFQNTLFLRLCAGALERQGLTVLRHRLVPPNDGGLALGQAAYAMYHLS